MDGPYPKLFWVPRILFVELPRCETDMDELDRRET